MYIFYFINENDDFELYAYTDSKKLVKMFEDFRDKKIFKKVKVWLEQEELMELYKTYNECELREFTTTTKSKHNKYGSYEITLAVTKGEEITIINESDYIIFNRLIEVAGKISPKIFKDDIIKALDVIDYSYNYYLYNDPEEINYEYQYDYSIDGFEIFYALFKKYIRKE